ncbi:MAG: 3-phosphoglycerate dehydrogenase family protein [Bacilli bacterium]|nr:3-phosphoglycerate dehydrogenase family protein [Bacilli bacterium]
MYKINYYNPIKEEAKKLFTNDYIESDLENCDAVLIRSTNILDLEMPKNVLCIGRAGVGVNTIPYKKYGKEGIVVFNTPGANANGVKEMTILGLILSQRDILGSINWVKSLAKCEDIVEKVEKEKYKYAGFELQGRSLGIIGLGAIGGLVANSAIDLGMEVYGYDPYISISHAWGLSKKINRVTTLDGLLEKSDIITIHTPLKEDTRSLLNAEAISKMKDGVAIINFARDALVVDDDIKKALESGKVSRYITDFPNPKTVNMKNTIVIPHLGGSTLESENNCAIMAVREVMDYLENGNISNSVNYPEVDAGICQTKMRITLNHLNVSGMINKFTSVFTKYNVNIARMYNNSLEDLAYSVFDLDNIIDDEAIKELENISEVLKVRAIKGVK